jgi:DNA-binding GntR family transcriptional regulator
VPERIDAESTALQVVHDSLRERILSGDLPPGVTLSQANLAREYGVSRSPVREACRMLEMEGFVESKVNYRVRVAEFSVSDLEEIYASRLVLETLALSRRLPRLTEAELNQMESALTEMRSAAEVRDYEQFATSHNLFHSFLITGVGSRLGQQIASLNDHSTRYRRVYTTQTPMAWDVVVTQDEAMLTAVLRGDFATATDELAVHLAVTALSTISLIDPLHQHDLIRAALKQVQHQDIRETSK